MACERFEKALIEEAIAPSGDAELTVHLASCADCREDLARQRELQERIMGGVAAMVADIPTQGLLARVRQQIAAERAPRAFPWMQWATAGFAVTACVVLVIWYAERPRGPVGQPQVQTVQVPAPAPPSARQPSQQAAQQFHASVAPVVKPLRSTVHQHAVVRTPSREFAQTAVADRIPAQGPEVIVPPGQHEAVLRLVAALQSGRVDAASLMRPAQPADVAPLKIALLEVKPLIAEEIKDDPGKQSNH